MQIPRCAIRRSADRRPRRATCELLAQGVTFQPGADPDLARRCLYQFPETTDHGLLGASGAGDRVGLSRLRMVQSQRQERAIAIDKYAGAALGRVPARDEYDTVTQRPDD